MSVKILSEKSNEITEQSLINGEYEHDDDLDGMSYLEELLGLDDYGYVDEGKLKPLDKNSGYKGKFNY